MFNLRPQRGQNLWLRNRDLLLLSAGPLLTPLPAKGKRTMKRRIRFSRFGLAEDPVGMIVTWKIGDRDYLARVVATYRSETRGMVMLKTRHFNGEDAPEVTASVVFALLPEWAS